MDLLDRFENYIKNEGLVEKGDSIFLGVSGGPDSLTMLDLFSRIRYKYGLEILVFHLNHMFRKEAEEEAQFVRRMSEKYGLEVIVEEFNVPEFIRKYSYSPEEGARIVRFDLLAYWAEKYNIKKLALAHNKDDLVETVFLNLFRGTGLKGLRGIMPRTSKGDLVIIHPLLDFYREEIESYCRYRKLNPCHDPSNREIIYTRNKIRNIIIPLIEKEINPALKEAVSRMAANIREEELFLAETGRKQFQNCLLKRDKGKIILSIKTLNEESKAIRRRIIWNAIQELRGDTADFYRVHYQIIEELIVSGQTGKTLVLKDNIQVRSSYDYLIFEQKEEYSKADDFSFELDIPGSVQWGDFIIETEVFWKDNDWQKLTGDKNICICDFDKVKGPLIVRNRRKGDYFYPFGMNNSKKIKDFFIDEKIALDERDKIPIITDQEGNVIWIAGYRADNRFRVDDTTRKILKLGINFTGGN